ncbi:MAG: GxxExxY protein [Planctomycetota bacterium]|nr:MAG: GxxExxY protein [Planctomycetota bacterium]
MPIEPSIPLTPISQAEFGDIAYEVTGYAYRIHKQLGRVFDESVYRRALAHLLGPRAIEEFPIRLSHAGFETILYLDLLVDHACPFELKVASELHDRHRGQLIQYLMLTGLHHGKLINFGSERVQDEFVNCRESTAHRRTFETDRSRWPAPDSTARQFEDAVIGLLRDWGTGLDRSLYLQALTHIFGGEETVCRQVQTTFEKIIIGLQRVNCVTVGVAFELTCLKRNVDKYEQQLRLFLNNTSLNRLLWANVVSGAVTLVAMEQENG